MRHAVRRRWGIAQALTALVVLTLAPLSLLEAYRGFSDVQRRREAVLQRALAQAADEADTMDDFLRLTERFLASLAASPAVQRFEPAQAEALFQAVQGQNPNYENVFLVDQEGQQIASTTPAVSDATIVERPYFREALASGRMAVSDVLVLEETNRSVVVLAHPVTSPDEQRSGVLAVALNISRLSTVIGYAGLPAGSVVMLLQGDGSIVAADEVEPWVGRSLSGTPVWREMLLSRRGTTTGRLTDGVERVIGFETLSRVSWRMVTAIPRSEVQAEVERSVRLIAGQSALALIATVAIGLVVLRTIVLPIRTLSEGAREFAAGRLDRRIPLRRRDELGDLAGALNAMAAALSRRLEQEAQHNAALRDLNRRQTDFVAVASHELRTPVAAIRTYTEALLRPDITDGATRQECLLGLDRSSARLAALTRTLLDVSRIDAGRLTVTLRPADVVAVARRVAQGAARSGRRVQFLAPPDPVILPVDADRLEDALANLVENACKFSPAEREVVVQVRPAPDGVAIGVEDAGPGIPAEARALIFDRFYQVEGGPARPAGGAGLGLYITRAYVEAMGGAVRVEDRPGGGAVFTIVLPREPLGAGATEGNEDGAVTDHRAAGG